jgi:hypothetical protein
MAVTVQSFLDDMARLGWEWGERDCLLWLGLWSRAVTGIDGGEEWRGRYRTALGCVRVMNKSGGMAACIERGATAAGMVETSEPVTGSVGMVTAATAKGLRDVGAIYTGSRWAILSSGGVVTGPFAHSRVWSFV